MVAIPCQELQITEDVTGRCFNSYLEFQNSRQFFNLKIRKIKIHFAC